MNSDVLMRGNVAEKKCTNARLIVRLITTWFISEHRKSCDRKTSAQSNIGEGRGGPGWGGGGGGGGGWGGGVGGGGGQAPPKI